MKVKTYYKIRKAAINEYLGGVCASCATSYNLQIDHKDPHKKNFNVLSRYWIDWNELVKELDLCQLLCYDCHLDKSSREGSFSHNQKPLQLKHGAAWTYMQYGCRCDACKQAKSKSRKPISRVSYGIPLDKPV